MGKKKKKFILAVIKYSVVVHSSTLPSIDYNRKHGTMSTAID